MDVNKIWPDINAEVHPKTERRYLRHELIRRSAKSCMDIIEFYDAAIEYGGLSEKHLAIINRRKKIVQKLLFRFF